MDLSVDLGNLDLADIGAWPAWLRIAAIGALAVAVAMAGHGLVLAAKTGELAAAEAREAALREEFQRKRVLADALEIERAKRDATAAAFANLLRRLPAQTEVPSLVEDITRAAVASDLMIGSIDLAEERHAEFYAELPIDIVVSGDYHRLGAFAAALAALSRTVTVHDFALQPRDGPANLTLTIAAKTYRYLDREPETAR